MGWRAVKLLGLLVLAWPVVWWCVMAAKAVRSWRDGEQRVEALLDLWFGNTP